MLDLKFGLAWQYGDKKGTFNLIHRPFMEGIWNWSPAFQMIADDVLDPYVKQAFQTEGASQGVNWKNLAPSTVARRGSAHPILRVTGMLEESFEKGGAKHREEIGPKKLVWGSDLPYPMFHEFGTQGRFNPKEAGGRKVLFKNPEAKARYEESQAQEGGLVPRPMLVYSRMLANEITSKMRGYATLIARQVGYRVAIRPGEAKVSPIEARQIGQSMLGV